MKRCGQGTWSRVVLGGLMTVSVACGAALAEDGLYLTDPASGREVRVDREGTLLHLAFFATWCPECLDELDELADLADRWSERGYRLVLVAVPERQSAVRLQRFVESHRPPGRVLLDRDGTVAARLKVPNLPTHVLLDPAGREVGRFDDAAAVGGAIEERLRSVSPGDSDG